MAQLPSVHMKLNPDNFDLLMTILAIHAEKRDVPGLSNDAHDLMDKRLRFQALHRSGWLAVCRYFHV